MTSRTPSLPQHHLLILGWSLTPCQDPWTYRVFWLTGKCSCQYKYPLKMHHNLMHSLSWEKTRGIEERKDCFHAGEQNVRGLMSAILGSSQWGLELCQVMSSLCVAVLVLVHPYRALAPVCVQLPLVFRVIFLTDEVSFWRFFSGFLDREGIIQPKAPGSNRVIILWFQNLTWKGSFCCNICIVSVLLAVHLCQLSLLILVNANVYTSKQKEEHCGLNLDLFNFLVSQLAKTLSLLISLSASVLGCTWHWPSAMSLQTFSVTHGMEWNHPTRWDRKFSFSARIHT